MGKIEVETKVRDKFRQEIPFLFKGIKEDAIRCAYKEGVEADQGSIAGILFDLADKSFKSVYNSQFKGKININLFIEIFENAIKSININEISNKIIKILDFGTLIYNSIIEFMNISFYLNKCELNKELILQRIFNNSDMILDNLFPNNQDKEFLKKKLKLVVDLEQPNKISLAQEAYDKMTESLPPCCPS